MTQHIFVIGSKPNPIFPDVIPSKVYAANGAISIAQRFSSIKNVEINGVLGKGVLSKKESKSIWRATSLLSGCSVSRLIVVGGGPKKSGYFTADQIGLQFFKVDNIHRIKTMALKLRYLKVARLFEKKEDESYIDLLRRLRKERSIPGLRISTGVLSLLFAMR